MMVVIVRFYGIILWMQPNNNCFLYENDIWHEQDKV